MSKQHEPIRPMGRPMHHPGRMPVVKPKNFTQTIRRLWSYFGKDSKKLAFIFLLLLLSAFVSLAAPYLIGKAVDAMSISQIGVDFGMLGIVILVLVIAYGLDVLLVFTQGWMMAGISQRVVQKLRAALFAKLQKLPLKYFDQRTHGEMMSRLSNDVDNVSASISQSTIQLLSGIIILSGTLIIMIVLSPILTLASLITVPLVFLLTRTITKRTKVLFKEQQAQLGKLNGHIEETISGFEVVKAFNREEKVIADFEKGNLRLRDVGIRAQIWSGFLMPMLNVINNLGFALIAIVGGFLAVNDYVTVGVIASFISYSRQFVRPLNELANIYNMLLSGVAGAERVFEVIDEKEEPEDVREAIELIHPKGDVRFEQVSFGYREDHEILHNISFHAPPGSRIALVGPTGAGKTTIVNLLTRFYDVTKGAILLDGIDLRQYTRDSLRRCFGVVLQDTYLFSGTIRDNITYGKPDATDEEVREAARLAYADGFIERLPQKYDTVLTENGGNLSLGQRQLLAIARVILAKPAILILDEATSSIDTRTEVHVQKALANLMKERTSFIIAHRLNTIRDADRILVIDKGTIVEQGNHEELLQQRGYYYRMVANQIQNVVHE